MKSLHKMFLLDLETLCLTSLMPIFAKALMSIGAVKAVEIGSGCESARKTGFENNDQITPDGFETNNSGGILAGISNGDDIKARVYVKPIPSILKPQKTVDAQGEPATLFHRGKA